MGKGKDQKVTILKVAPAVELPPVELPPLEPEPMAAAEVPEVQPEPEQVPTYTLRADRRQDWMAFLISAAPESVVREWEIYEERHR